MAIWHTPKILAVKFNGDEHAVLEPSAAPLTYFPMGDGEWRLQFRLVPEKAKRGLFGYSNRQIVKVDVRVPTLNIAVEAEEVFREPLSDARSLATGSAVGVATALGVPEFLAGLAGFASLGNGEAVILKLTAPDIPKPGNELRLLVKGTIGLCADLQPKLIEKRARDNW